MHSGHLSSNFIIISIIPAIILLIFTICIIIYLIHRLRRTIPLLHLSYNSHRFSYNQLLAATNSFSPHYAIGKGSSATVYRGVLTNGDSVAVKLIHASSSSSSHLQFHNELSILSALTSPYVVSLLGYCIRNDDLILVYEYMPNRSLQEALFDDSSRSESDLSWDHRFRIVKDVANALAYLHLECHPPVIHGDLKPSNVLLDIDFRARVSDFGLSRVKEEELSGNVPNRTPAGSSSHLSYNDVADDSAQPPQAASAATVKNEYIGVNENGGEEDLEQGRQWGKDWWWRQDGSGELCTKDYVTEWIGSQICSTTDHDGDWDDDQDGEKSAATASHHSPPVLFQLQADKEGEKWTMRRDKKKTHRKLHEWWGDDHHPPDISKTRVKLRKLEKKLSKSFKKPILTFSRSLKLLRRRRKFEQRDASNCHIASDFSLTNGWKKNKEEAHAHPGCSEIWSGDLFSRELSSTTSMRGTLCYVAPECGGGGCGYLMEKADIYSLGVLILVVVSGRRPLHVLSSPMKFEKANLVSWCRHLAQNGNVLELVDKRLKQRGYSKDQAALCINLALSCLQKMPELRPDIGDVVKILNGEMDMLAVPFEFSPSPPSRLLSRSRSQQKANGV